MRCDTTRQQLIASNSCCQSLDKSCHYIVFLTMCILFYIFVIIPLYIYTYIILNYNNYDKNQRIHLNYKPNRSHWEISLFRDFKIPEYVRQNRKGLVKSNRKRKNLKKQVKLFINSSKKHWLTYVKIYDTDETRIFENTLIHFFIIDCYCIL